MNYKKKKLNSTKNKEEGSGLNEKEQFKKDWKATNGYFSVAG